MRKIIALSVLTVVLLLAVFVGGMAQITTPTSTLDFSLIFRPPSDPRPVEVVTGFFRWFNARGRTETVNMDVLGEEWLDSTVIASRGKPVTFVRADSTTLAARYGRTMKTWVITVTDTTRASVGVDYGTVEMTILDLTSGVGRDTSLFISSAGLECNEFIIDVIDVGFAPYDSIRTGDRTIMSWITFKWQ